MPPARPGWAILGPWTTRPAGTSRSRPSSPRSASPCPARSPSRTTRCQRPGCHCHADPPLLHGPYPTWTRKTSSRTVTRTLTPEDAERLRPYFDAHRRLRQLIAELEAISIELAEHPETPKTPGDQPA